MTKTKTPSIVTQIVDKLYSEGPKTVSQLCETIKFTYKSVYTKALELQKMNLVERTEEGVWSLRDGVTPETLITGEIGAPGAAPPGAEEGEPGKPIPPIVRGKGVPLDQRGMFIEHMTAIGVSPREAIPTIADLFFEGDIEDLNWLNRVLQRSAAGYVKANQRRLIMDWWSKTRNLPYDEEAYFSEEEREGKAGKAAAKTGKVEEKVEKRLDPGMGWKVDRAKDGAWITVPGGPMSYQEAVEAAERRALIDSYAHKDADQGAEGEEVSEEGAAARKGGKKPESLVEYLMKKMVDKMLEGPGTQGDGASETVRALTERIENMERDSLEKRFDNIEGALAQMAARDPWEDYDKIEAMKQRFGGGSSVVTDQSPAVQLIKDTTDKMDKNVSRMVGLFERTMLHSDVFNPEKTRTKKERDETAGDLLSEVESRDRSRGLRKDTFGF